MGLDNEILRFWREFCDDLAQESETLREFFANLLRREEFARLSRSHCWRIETNPDLPPDDPWQRQANHSLFRLYLGRTSHYVLTCVSQPKDDDSRPDIVEVLTDLAAFALNADRVHESKNTADPYFIPIPPALERGAYSEDWLFWKPLRLPLLVGRRFQDHLGRSRWEIMARRLRRLRFPSSASLVHSREWWSDQYRRLNNSKL
jgi:hypothetical protein